MNMDFGVKELTAINLEVMISLIFETIVGSLLSLYQICPPSSGWVSESAQKGAIRGRAASSGKIPGIYKLTGLRKEICPFALTYNVYEGNNHISKKNCRCDLTYK